MPEVSTSRGAAGRATQFRLSALCRGPALFLQPRHGATLACGGAAALIAQAGWPSIIVSTGVDPEVGAAAALRARRPGLPACDPATVVTLRRAEEVCAAAVLGCGMRWLDLADGPEDGAPGPAGSSDLARFIALEVLRAPDWREGTQVFVPVAARQSPAHRVLFEAGRTLAACGVRVWAYEDVECALAVPGAADVWVADAAGALGTPLLLAIDTVLPRKLDAIGCQVSELSRVCPSMGDLRGALAGHAWRLGEDAGGQACERYWPVLG